MSPLQEAKLALMGVSDLAKDALHVHVGLVAFFAAALLLRWPIRSGKPWALALLVALVGEGWDIIDTWAAGNQPVLAGNWHDIWNTMLWPTLVTLLARWTPALSRR